jgi:DNA-binding NarL/FixJ family response regulator
MNGPVVNYSQLRFLVIDDQAVSRQTLRNCAQNMGAFSVMFSETYADAIFRIRNNPPSIILCDYMLGNGRSGQQLLEELRRFDLLPDECIFIMVTAEQSYEQVVSAVELVPDDYILKPFSADLLQTRLDRAVAKKLFLMPYYRARRAKKFDEAQASLHKMEQTREGKLYSIDLMRAQAELYILMDRGPDAEAIYQRILEIYSFPWANAGKARALLQQQRVEEARTVVDALVDEAPMFLSAYDLKAQICTSMGDLDAAQETLKIASAKSPRNYVRKRSYANAALANGDVAEARAVMEDVVANDTIAGGLNIHDYLSLVRAALDEDDSLSADKAIRAAASFEIMDWPARVSFTALRSIVMPDEGRANFLAMRESWLTAEITLECFVDVIRAALAAGDTELADQVANRLMVQEGVRGVFQPTIAAYKRYGREQVFREIQRSAALSRIHSTPPTAKPAEAPPEEPVPAEADDSGMTFL